MKLILTLLCLLFVTTGVFAQVDSNKLLFPARVAFPRACDSNNKVAVTKSPGIRICAPSKGALMAPPLIVIFSHDKVIYKSSEQGALNKISPQSIKSIIILKDSSSVAKYGDSAKNGVIQIYLDDQKYPGAYKAFKADSAESKRR